MARRREPQGWVSFGTARPGPCKRGLNPGIADFTRLTAAKHITAGCLHQVCTFPVSVISVNTLQ